MNKSEYFKANMYSQLSWYSAIMSIVCLVAGWFEVASYWWWIPGAIPAASFIIIRILGKRAYRNYLKTLEP